MPTEGQFECSSCTERYDSQIAAARCAQYDEMESE